MYAPFLPFLELPSILIPKGEKKGRDPASGEYTVSCWSKGDNDEESCLTAPCVEVGDGDRLMLDVSLASLQACNISVLLVCLVC